MQTIDFSRSFLTFRIDTRKKPSQTASHAPPFSLNNARIQLECQCVVTEKESGWTQTYVLGASCKTERVGVDKGIWTEPNADYIPIFSVENFMNIKTFARSGMTVELYPPGSGSQSERQTGRVAEAFDSVRIDLAERPAEQLTSADQIVRATLANAPINARTTLKTARYQAVIDYPVKTMNANERDNVFQTDTGPVLLPDFTSDPERMLAGLELAFAAFNCFRWIEFLVRVPTAVSDDVLVFHYSKSVRFEAHNEIFRMPLHN